MLAYLGSREKLGEDCRMFLTLRHKADPPASLVGTISRILGIGILGTNFLDLDSWAWNLALCSHYEHIIGTIRKSCLHLVRKVTADVNTT